MMANKKSSCKNMSHKCVAKICLISVIKMQIQFLAIPYSMKYKAMCKCIIDNLQFAVVSSRVENNTSLHLHL